mgnify:CR=1 FL=1
MEQISSHEHWIDVRLSQEEMVFLNKIIITEEQRNDNEDWKETTRGIVSRCNLIDTDNWFYETVLKKLSERMYCQDWKLYKKHFIDKEEPLPKFELSEMWVNYQKQHDIVPIHNHGLPLSAPMVEHIYSFVIFIKIPTHWEEQQIPSKSLKSDIMLSTAASDFQFMWSEKNSEEINIHTIHLSPEDGGRMLFFHSGLMHQVCPFYECEEERITISGNIQPLQQKTIINNPIGEMSGPSSVEISSVEIEEKEFMLELMKNNVQQLEEQLKYIKLNRKKT